MEQLETTHLAIYLPHKLQVQVKRGTGELIALKKNEAIIMGKYYPFSIDLKEITPLVRPLNQLTKKININGNIFTPFNILKTYNRIGYHFNIEKEQLEYIIENNQLDMGKMPYWFVNTCAIWHFDVNNLLNRKLAKALK